MQNRQVVYLLSGPSHAPYVAASLWSLRKSGYDGQVVIHAWPESIGYARIMAADERLKTWACEREPKLRREDGLGRNAQGLDRIDLMMSFDDGVTVYLDADTSVHGDISPMFEEAEKTGYCATQFCDWTMRGVTAKRIRGLAEVKGIPTDLVNTVLANSWPSLNCGVFAAKPDSPLLPKWYEWTKACGRLFISDERAQHLLMAAFPDQMSILMGGAFNCSPKFQPENVSDDDVVVRHYHGHSNVKPGKSEKGIRIWDELWKEVLDKNIGYANRWWSQCGNKHMVSS